VNPPTGSESGRRNLSIGAQLWIGAEANEILGVAFDSSAGFELPKGAIRAADASWVRRDAYGSLSDLRATEIPLS